MTNRDKLVEIMLRCPRALCDHCGDDNWLEANAQQFADHLLANGVTVHEWISTKDRLPGKIPVLCLDQIGKMSVMRYEYDRLVGECWFDDYEQLINFDWVTHWMPLPKQQKESE